MKKITSLILLVFLIINLSADTKVAGVTVEDELSSGGTDYSLVGAGIRTKVILRLYVGSLYTDRAIEDEYDVLRGPASSVIRLDIISGLITSELMQETIIEGFEKAMSGDTSSLQSQIDDFIGVFSEPISKGDQFTFISTPGTGVVAYKGDRKLTDIGNDRFREVLFTIWLGPDPADKKLKKGMLDK